MLRELIYDNERAVCEESHGYEYMILTNDKISSGYPIEPIVYFSRKKQRAYLVDNAGIIWHENFGVFRRYCKGACLAYIKTYWGDGEAEYADGLSTVYNDIWEEFNETK